MLASIPAYPLSIDSNMQLIRRLFSTPAGPKAAWLYTDSANGLVKILCELAGKPRKPPCHLLCFEALAHMTSPALAQAFPLITTDFVVHRNLMLLHFSMIAQRFLYEETREALHQYYDLFDRCDKYIFERYLDLVEDIVDVPVAEFECELVEMIATKFAELEKSIACYGYSRPFLVLNAPANYNLSACLLHEVFENRISPSDPHLKRLTDYFLVHVMAI